MLPGNLTRATKLRKGPIRCHETRQHGGDQLERIADGLTALVSKELSIGKQIAMHGRGKLKSQLHRLIVGDSAE
jgi:hypothetical protein